MEYYLMSSFFSRRIALSLLYLIFGVHFVLTTLVTSSTAAVATLSNRALEMSVKEELPPGTIVGSVKDASDLPSLYSDDILNTLSFSWRRPTSGGQVSGGGPPGAEPASSGTVAAGMSANPTRYFSIDETSGVIRTSRRLDRELLCPPSSTETSLTSSASSSSSTSCTLTLDVTVRPNQYFQIIRVNINVIDVNDNAPTFPQSRVTIEIKESSVAGTLYPVPIATDPDSGILSVQTYALMSTTPADKFQLVVLTQRDGSKEVRLNLTERLDRETRDSYAMVIVASDGGTPPRTGSVAVDVIVLDANDNIPTFERTSYDVEVKESTVAGGATIARVHATDPDQGDNGVVQYSFAEATETAYGRLFGIDNRTGEIFLKGAQGLDYERQAYYQLTVVATDLGHGSLPAFAKVGVNVVDENDNSPVISVNSLTSSGLVEVAENADAGLFVAYVTVKDADSGKNGQVTCYVDDDEDVTAGREVRSMAPISHLFALDSLYGGTEFKLTTLATFDRELKALHVVPLTCVDAGLPTPRRETIHVNVHVIDENDHSPVIAGVKARDELIFDVVEGNRVGALIASIIAADSDTGDNAALTFRVDALPHGDVISPADIVSIDSTTGRLIAEEVFDFEKRHEYRFKLTVSDRSETSPLSTSTTLVLRVTDVNDEPPTFDRVAYHFTTTENLPAGTSVGRVRASDADVTPAFAKITYCLSRSGGICDGNGGVTAFEVDTTTGVLSTQRPLDREEFHVYEFFVVAYNEAPAVAATAATRTSKTSDSHHKKEERGTLMRSFANVTVHVEDVNDNAPAIRFPAPSSFHQSLSASVKGSEGGAETRSNVVQISSFADAGAFVTRVDAVDADVGRNAHLSYAIVNGNEDRIFDIDSRTGSITLARSPPRHPAERGDTERGEETSDTVYRLVLAVSDRGTPEPLQTITELTVFVNASMAAAAALLPPKAALNAHRRPGSAAAAGAPLPLHNSDSPPDNGLEKFMIIAGVIGAAIIIVFVGVIIFVVALLVRRRRRRHAKRREYFLRQGCGGGMDLSGHQSPIKYGSGFISTRSCSPWRDGDICAAGGGGSLMRESIIPVGGGGGSLCAASMVSSRCCSPPLGVRSPSSQDTTAPLTAVYNSGGGTTSEREETDDDDDVQVSVPLHRTSRTGVNKEPARLHQLGRHCGSFQQQDGRQCSSCQQQHQQQQQQQQQDGGRQSVDSYNSHNDRQQSCAANNRPTTPRMRTTTSQQCDHVIATKPRDQITSSRPPGERHKTAGAGEGSPPDENSSRMNSQSPTSSSSAGAGRVQGRDELLIPARSLPQVRCARCRRSHVHAPRGTGARRASPRKCAGSIKSAGGSGGAGCNRAAPTRRITARPKNACRSDIETGSAHPARLHGRESESECSASYFDSGMDPSEDSDHVMYASHSS